MTEQITSTDFLEEWPSTKMCVTIAFSEEVHNCDAQGL